MRFGRNPEDTRLRSGGVLYLGSLLDAEPCRVHLEKSISLPHPEQICTLLNSSEKISFSFPHSGQLKTNERKCLRLSQPGQCAGVFISPPSAESPVSFPIIPHENIHTEQQGFPQFAFRHFPQ
jgi:hypothetical protein